VENGNSQKLAEQIAQLLESQNKNDDSNFLRASLEKINQRLDKIEAQISQQNPESRIPNPKSFHASQERFTNLAELADEIIANLQNEKACPFEPAGKPCDNCSMCSSRGF
jgi:Arc/MetJ-type ribon-helix-helix transcriptional regulator